MNFWPEDINLHIICVACTLICLASWQKTFIGNRESVTSFTNCILSLIQNIRIWIMECEWFIRITGGIENFFRCSSFIFTIFYFIRAGTAMNWVIFKRSWMKKNCARISFKCRVDCSVWSLHYSMVWCVLCKCDR